ncbi:hypothetical protein LIA77_05783 [Sarocladium implicatum]|nr:hypothetical protein LIA77_05783 [Sarocladium implicatum]
MTSRPVAIPTIGSLPVEGKRPTHNLEKHGLCFGLIDISESGDTSWLMSDGSGKFAQLKPGEAVPPLAFIIEKRRVTRHLVVELLNTSLKSTICSILGRVDVPGNPLELDVGTLLARYESVKGRLSRFQQQCPRHQASLTLDLLLNGCLLDHSLYEGIDVEVLLSFSKAGFGCQSLAQDLVHKKFTQGLDELDDCFRLGLASAQTTLYEISAFNYRFEQLAYAGKLSQLQEHVEPAVKSGEVTIKQDDALLANVLGGGHRATHAYLIDLSQRTLTSNIQGLRLWNRDVSTDPMYEAIIHDQMDLVRLFASTGHYFSGTINPGHLEPPPSRITPLVAAAYWNKANIVRMLLDLGSPYLDGWTHAVSWSVAHDLQEILSILREHKKWQVEHLWPTAPGHLAHSNSEASFPETGITVRRYYDTPQPLNAPFGKATDLSPRGYGLAWDDDRQQFDRLSLFPSGTPASAPRSSSWIASPENSSKSPSPYPAYNVVQPSPAQDHRVRIGQSLVSRLQRYCERLQFNLKTSSWVSPTLMSSFSSPKRIWQAGMGCFRRVVRNQSPSSGIEAAQMLLVAVVLQQSTHMSDDGPLFADHAKLRTMINPEEQPLYDELVWLLFNRTQQAGPEHPTSLHELCRIQELAQSLISVNGLPNGYSGPWTLRGLRLPFVYSSHYRWQWSDDQSNTSSKSARATSSTIMADGYFDPMAVEGDDDFNIFDYIKVEAVQDDEADLPEAGSYTKDDHDATWKNLDPRVVLLLGSEMFSAILEAIQRVQLPPRRRSGAMIHEDRLAGNARGTTTLHTLEEFCSTSDFQRPTSSSGFCQVSQIDGVNASLIPLMKGWIHGSSDVGATLSQSLDPNFLLGETQSATLSPGDTS